MGKTVAKVLLSGLLLLAVAGGAAYWYFGEAAVEFLGPEIGGVFGGGEGVGGGGVAEAAPQDPASQAIAVEASEVAVEAVADEVTVAGTLRSNEDVLISPEIPGRISEIHFREGEAVEEGAPLFSLDDEIYRAELAEAEANLNLSQANYERAGELFERGAGTARARDEALAQLETAKAAVGLARARLAKTRITAPFAGIVGLRRVSVGEYVTAGQELVNLEDIDPIKVDFRIPERFLTAVEVDQPVGITVEALPGRTFEGEVYAIDPQIDPAGRSIAVQARIDNDRELLRPGLFARVGLIIERRENAVTVPEQALVPRDGGNSVFKVVDGRAVLTEVEVGLRRRGRAEIVSGLGRGDVVVTAGQMKLRDGALVDVITGGEVS